MIAWASRSRGHYGHYGDAAIQISRRVIFHVGFVGAEWTYAITLGRLFVEIHW